MRNTVGAIILVLKHIEWYFAQHSQFKRNALGSIFYFFCRRRFLETGLSWCCCSTKLLLQCPYSTQNNQLVSKVITYTTRTPLSHDRIYENKIVLIIYEVWGYTAFHLIVDFIKIICMCLSVCSRCFPSTDLATCKTTVSGWEYRGTLGHTLDGRPCQNWSADVSFMAFSKVKSYRFALDVTVSDNNICNVSTHTHWLRSFSCHTR